MWNWFVGLLVLGVVLHSSLAAQDVTKESVSAEEIAGVWRAELEGGGGPVEFGLILAAQAESLQAFITNGPETIKVPQVSWDGRELRIGFDHFQSVIVAAVASDGKQMTGSFTREKAGRVVAQLRFVARREEGTRQFEPAEPWLGTWRVKFGDSPEPAIGLFRRDPTATSNRPQAEPGAEPNAAEGESQVETEAVVGTFLTPTGDYRYLSGGVRGGVLQLSCFDGTHVYLFHCRLTDEQRIQGEFWSGATSRISWAGERDETAKLPDAFQLTTAQAEVDWGSLQFPDLDGQPRRLDDPQFVGPVRLIYLFGSWCPNCHDAAVFFGRLQQRYGERGLRVLGLAFEATGEFEQDVVQVQIYARRHQIGYPLLIAGLADKELASRSLPFLDRVRSFPTAILVDGSGRVRAVYTGFNGPATGEAYAEQERRFAERIEAMLGDKPN